MDHVAAGAPDFSSDNLESADGRPGILVLNQGNHDATCPDRRSQPDELRRGGDTPASETAGLD